MHKNSNKHGAANGYDKELFADNISWYSSSADDISPGTDTCRLRKEITQRIIIKRKLCYSVSLCLFREIDGGDCGSSPQWEEQREQSQAYMNFAESRRYRWRQWEEQRVQSQACLNYAELTNEREQGMLAWAMPSEEEEDEVKGDDIAESNE